MYVIGGLILLVMILLILYFRSQGINTYRGYHIPGTLNSIDVEGLTKNAPLLVMPNQAELDNAIIVNHYVGNGGKTISIDKVNNLSECGRKCNSLSECNSFSYDDIEKTCALRSAISNKNNSTYFRVASGKFKKIPGLKLRNYSSVLAESEVDCAKSCMGNPDCGGFDYDIGSKACNTHKVYASMDMVSGYLPSRLDPVTLAKTSEESTL